MIQYPSNTSIQQFQRLENVSSDLMNLFYTTTTESLNAYFPISPCIMSGINDISNNYGQIGTSNVFEFAAGAVRFPNQITVIPGSIIKEFTWTPYAAASITLNGITDGTIYYCVAKLTQIANDSYKVTNTMTIPDTVVTASGLNDQNVALFAITSDAGVYTVFLDNNCAYNYGAKTITNNLVVGFNSNITTGFYTSATYANGLWVIANAGFGGVVGIYYSSNGTTWTRSNITTGGYTSATYANGLWVIGSGGFGGAAGIYYSSNGTTWTQSNITTGSYNSATYANGLWVIGSGGFGGIYYSNNGTTWTQSNITTGFYNSATYANGLWVIGSGVVGIYYSNNGTTWTQSNITTDSYSSATYANGLWVIGSFNGNGIYYSNNGTTWTQSNITTGDYNFATYANGLWVIGSGGAGIYYSNNGTTWTQSNITTGAYTSATYANGLWVIGSSGAAGIYYSNNGTTWTQSNITTGFYTSATYANGLWVIGNSDNGGIYYLLQLPKNTSESNPSIMSFSFALNETLNEEINYLIIDAQHMFDQYNYTGYKWNKLTKTKQTRLIAYLDALSAIIDGTDTTSTELPTAFF